MNVVAGGRPSGLEGKRILVTGATGSLGKTLLRRILAGEWGRPARVIAFSRDEAKQHALRVSYLHSGAATDEVIYRNFQRLLQFWIGDIRDYADVCAVLARVDVVFNAAALKQVPSCEYFPMQALMTNCLGAENIVRALREHDFAVEAVIGISTDKACKPINVMGMTKALQERIFIAANIHLPRTRFCCVRYGNVLASRGSVIPLFHEQIRRGGPVDITNPAMTRFLLTLDQAVDTVMAALFTGRPGDTYIPDAPSVTIENLARALIGTRAIETRCIGERPGEKMHEILISAEETAHTVRRGAYLVIRSLLPELREAPPAASAQAAAPIEAAAPAPAALARELSSATAPLDAAGTRALLARNGLLLEQCEAEPGEELLR
jgi:UDP-glucose 4-epimerase